LASLGHIAVGLAATRTLWGPPTRAWAKSALFWCAVSFLPDADVIGFPLGVRYEDEWVAISAENRIVAHGKTYADTIAQVENPEEVAMFRVPPLDATLAPSGA